MESHEKMFEKLIEMNGDFLVFVEKIALRDSEPYIYKVRCLPSSRNKTIKSSQSLKTAREITVRILTKDIAALVSISGDKKFCDVDDIQSRMDKAVFRNQRYIIENVTVNGFGDLAILTLTTEE